jgi:murein DD-endopeptidase MepM/ murein hydrolase activator NlpD
VKARQSTVFGRRKEPHTVIIARGDDVRHFTVRPWVAGLFGSALAVMAIGYLLATSYLVLRDDLIGASTARQARMQQAYEDRISMLRAQVDRITSRQLLDQQIVETKVSELLARQDQLSQRHGRLGPILDNDDRSTGATLPVSPPLPANKPELRANLGPADSTKAVSGLALSFLSSAPNGSHETAADRADRVFVSINKSLRAIESEQIDGVETLAGDAFRTADEIAEALRSAGLEVDLGHDDDAIGGPLVPVDADPRFDDRVRELDEALDRLETVKTIAKSLPVHNPAPGQAVSSSYGVRKDPLLGTPAMHAGIDFRAGPGTPILATGAGIVVKAGWNGGYGRMVEIDHGGGITTRYAHMSRILVKEGERVTTGEVVGEVGSSGRSTGPHLHYEVRREGSAMDPLRFLKVGKTISELM